MESEAKTLSDKQRNKSLSSQKKIRPKPLRNVLAKCFEDYWPVIDPDKADELNALIVKCFPLARRPDVAQELNKCKREERKEKKKILLENVWDANPLGKMLRSDLALGVNEVARFLEADQIESLIIAEEADPQILVRHLGTLASTRNVPYIVVTGLKTSTKSALEFSSLAVGFKKNVTKADHQFNEVHKKVQEFCKSFVGGLAATGKETAEAHLMSEDAGDENSVEVSSACNSLRKPTDIYLYRRSKNYRVFVPEKRKEETPEFLSLSGTDDDDNMKFSQSVDLNSDRKNVKKTSVLGLKESDLQSNSDNNIANYVETLGSKQGEATRKRKTVPARYFNPQLAPLKVKRIQPNPNKSKKQKKN